MADLVATDTLEPGLLARFRATLGPWLAPVPEGTAPLGAHWCLFPPLADTAHLGPDGHPPRLHPIPEAEFPRRMWVGGNLDLQSPFPADTPIERRTVLRPIERKQGSTGLFLLTGLDQVYTAGGATIATERQDIVYRPAHAGPPTVLPLGGPIPPADLRRDIETDAALLFRYSAVTFNAHRIHYDRDHARNVEGHADILVHGPLQASWLLNAAADLLGRTPVAFRYRALGPLAVGKGAVITATRAPDGVMCRVHDRAGRPTMEGHAR